MSKKGKISKDEVRVDFLPAFFETLAATFPNSTYLFCVNFDPGETPQDTTVGVMGIRPARSPTLRALEGAGVDVKGAFDEKGQEISDLLCEIMYDAIDKAVEKFAERRRKEEGA